MIAIGITSKTKKTTMRLKRKIIEDLQNIIKYRQKTVFYSVTESGKEGAVIKVQEDNEIIDVHYTTNKIIATVEHYEKQEAIIYNVIEIPEILYYYRNKEVYEQIYNMKTMPTEIIDVIWDYYGGFEIQYNYIDLYGIDNRTHNYAIYKIPNKHDKLNITRQMTIKRDLTNTYIICEPIIKSKERNINIPIYSIEIGSGVRSLLFSSIVLISEKVEVNYIYIMNYSLRTLISELERIRQKPILNEYTFCLVNTNQVQGNEMLMTKLKNIITYRNYINFDIVKKVMEQYGNDKCLIISGYGNVKVIAMIELDKIPELIEELKEVLVIINSCKKEYVVYV